MLFFELLGNFDLGGPAASLIAFGAGIALHQGLFKHGEWDNYSLRIAQSAFVATASLGSVSYLCDGAQSWGEALKLGCRLVATVISGICYSMFVYRAFFHQLNSFPGPLAARLSTIYITAKSIPKCRTFVEVQKLHQKYGDIVRVGPSELSIADPKAFNAIHLNSTTCEKGPFYNSSNPLVSLQMVRDKKQHDRRRKAWDKAFSGTALRDYEVRVNKYLDQLLEVIDKHVDQPFDATNWFNFYTFDVMGDIAFGKRFEMLKGDFKNWVWHAIHKNAMFLGFFSRWIWLYPIVKGTPGLNHEYLKSNAWIKGETNSRIQNKPDHPDVFHWILDDYNSKPNPTEQETYDLYGDCSLIVIAGSDTTACALTTLFYLFAAYPETYKKLQKEVDELFAMGGPRDNMALSKLKYMQACIDENLRLYPPVPGGVQRVTGPHGLQIGETYIPGRTIVTMHSWTMYRDPRAFVKPDKFIPERWTTQTELVKDDSAFAPFSTGRYSCVGKQLGLIEVRRTTALIAARYDVSLAPGCDPKKFEEGVWDGFTLFAPGLNLVFTKRENGAVA